MLLRCPVRGCQLELAREDRQVVCSRGHSFDIARSGYINLLQPQERRSKQPGDTAEAVAARRRLHDRGLSAPLVSAIADFARLQAGDAVLDAGCGEGFYLGLLARQAACNAHGIDISTAAIQLAAIRYPNCEWVVGNADRSLPYLDQSFSIVLSITSRRNPHEFSRVLKTGGRLLVAIPAPDDLMELRGKGRDRTTLTIEEFAPAFSCLEQRRITTTADLDAAAVQDVLHSIYRPLQIRAPEPMRLTFSLDLLLFEQNTFERVA